MNKGSIKVTIITLMIGIPIMIWAASLNREVESEPVVRQEKNVTFDDLLDAIEFVESGGEEYPEVCIGDGGDAVGAYQIHKIYVDDANRIVGWDKFLYADRWDRDNSREMTSIVIQHYGKGDFETMARIHNGGPNGWKKESTKKYWNKVKIRLESL